jgi:hypothetical protein
MVHVFLIFHCCRQECKEEICGDQYSALIGKGGHGWAWQTLAKAVEDYANSATGLNMEGVNLGCSIQLIEQYEKTGIEPSEEEIKALNFSDKEIKRVMHEIQMVKLVFMMAAWKMH